MTDTTQRTPRVLSSIELRYVLTLYLFDHGATTVSELIWAIAEQGFTTRTRASKAISDALRSECTYGRVYRIGRGRYRPASMPRGTEHRIHQRVWSLRDEVGSRDPGPPPRATPDATGLSHRGGQRPYCRRQATDESDETSGMGEANGMGEVDDMSEMDELSWMDGMDETA